MKFWKRDDNVKDIQAVKQPQGENKVFVTLGETINLGDYNSFKHEAGVSLTVNDKESIAEAFERAMIAVMEKMISDRAKFGIKGIIPFTSNKERPIDPVIPAKGIKPLNK